MSGNESESKENHEKNLNIKKRVTNNFFSLCLIEKIYTVYLFYV